MTKANNILKSHTSEQLNPESALSAYEWINKPYNQRGLQNIVRDSVILPQCIEAYADNIAGFGVGVRYKDEFNSEAESLEMKQEFEKVQNIIKMLGAEIDVKEILMRVIKNRETFGIAYLECIRNLNGDVVQIENIKDVPSVEMTKPDGDFISYECRYGDEVVTRGKQFRKFRQIVAGKTVYFKEFGDTRIMDKRTGEYVESLDIVNRANEILVFSIGDYDYGEVRWIGQVLPQDGARKSEQLNNNYFLNGRHIPLMIAIRGGTLTDESKAKLKTYLNGIRGESAQHGFLIIEAESNGNRTAFDEDKPDIQVVPLSSILQQDALFQKYQDDARKKAQSAFRLPALYVGYTKDYDRATSYAAMEVTEKQVFQPERVFMAWQLNNKLLKSYDFKYCEVYLKEPEISNPDDMAKLISVANSAGGVTPNLAREIACKSIGRVSEDYKGNWGNIPLVYIKNTISQANTAVNAAISKARRDNSEDIIPILKGIKDAINEITKHTGGGE